MARLKVMSTSAKPMWSSDTTTGRPDLSHGLPGRTTNRHLESVGAE